MGPRHHREPTHRIIRSLAKRSAARQPEGLIDAMASLHSPSAPWRCDIMFDSIHALLFPFTRDRSVYSMTLASRFCFFAQAVTVARSL